MQAPVLEALECLTRMQPRAVEEEQGADRDDDDPLEHIPPGRPPADGQESGDDHRGHDREDESVDR